MIIRSIASILLLLTISACGGDAPPDKKTTPPKIMPPDFADLAITAGLLHDHWDSEPVTDPASLPYGGNAQFAGVLALRFQTSQGDYFVNGALQIDVDFAENRVSGGADSFVDSDQIYVGGRLSITGGIIDRLADLATQHTISGNVSGTLDATPGSFSVTGDMLGDFSGNSHGAVIGTVAGSANGDGGLGYVFGEFIVEQ